MIPVKRVFRRGGLLILFLMLCSVAAFADMGPKPSVILSVSGVNAECFYVTLLSESTSTGPYSYAGEDGIPDSIPMEGTEDIWQKFSDYQDTDGYYFLQYYDLLEPGESGSDEFVWGYYPPDTFKVLIYAPETDAFYCSKTMETYAFHSRYEVVAEGKGTLSISRTYGWGWEVFGFLVRLLLTVGIEMLIAPVFGFRSRKQLLVILGVNVVTQVILNVVLISAGYTSVFLFYVLEYFWLEVLVFAVEAAVYMVMLKEPQNGKKLHPIVYSLTANFASLLVGYLLSDLFTFIF